MKLIPSGFMEKSQNPDQFGGIPSNKNCVKLQRTVLYTVAEEKKILETEKNVRQVA